MSGARLQYEHFEILTDDHGAALRLGPGGMGTTYRAYDSRLRRPVALKIINERFLSDPSSRRRFFNEARAAALIDHPNVARVLYLCPKDAAECFFAMELVEGESLADRIARHGPQSPAEALLLLHGVADALTALGKHGLVHRDIKPENIMIAHAGTRPARVKLIDFGLAKSLGQQPDRFESVHTGERFVGSVYFASPEQIRPRGVLDCRSDFYSLGATLWHCLTGFPPFTGTIFEVQEGHVYDEPPWAKIAPLPPPIHALLRRLLAKDPERRPPDAEALVVEWDAALAGLEAFSVPTIPPVPPLERVAVSDASMPTIVHQEAIPRREQPPPASGRPPISLELGVAKVVPGTAGVVRSPYGSRQEQRVSGPHWRGDAKIYCEETNRLFTLPRVLPALEALLIEGRYDAVLSTYVEPPREVPVPLGRWKPDEEITCDITGLPLRLPDDLPLPVGDLVASMPGVVRSPYGDHRVVTVPPNQWEPGERLMCPASGQVFVLPGALPALHALPTEVSGCFTSPYAPDQRFTLQPHECVAGFACACPFSDKPLAVPPSLPRGWKFEGRVRQADVPEAQSPFIAESDSNLWQPLTAEQWKPRTIVRCAQTGREFVLPEALPLLAVEPAPNPPAVLSPFLPSERWAVPIGDWQPGAEVTVILDRGTQCRVVLPEGELPPLAAVPGDVAGAFTSPYPPKHSFTLPPWACLPGARLPCPITGRPLMLPEVLPAKWRWEGVVQQTSIPEARSPFVPDESSGETMQDERQAWQPLAPSEWRPGASICCRATGQPFVLPTSLPPLRVLEGPSASTVLSPFPPHEPIAIPPPQWRRSAEVEIRLSSGLPCRVLLPDGILPLGRAEVSELAVLPLGFDPKARARGGAIRSPHGDQPWVEVSAKEWLPGVRMVCPATQRPFWLPAELPALEARLGRPPGTVWSPYTDRAVEIPPDDWHGGEAVRCAETGGWFVLPAELPLLTARADDSRPGVIESPFAPGESFRVEMAEWKPANVLTCPRTGRRFVLPDDLPEWIAEVEVIAAGSGMVRSPYGSRVAFKVRGEDWMAGGPVTCPETGQRGRLPDRLPPMDATLVEKKPGFVRSPYDIQAIEQKISRRAWYSTGTVRCSATGRPMRLPENLPAQPKVAISFGAYTAFATAVLAVLVVSAGIGIPLMLNRPSPSSVLTARGIPTPPFVLSTPAPISAPTPPPPPKIVEEWPRKFVFSDGIAPTPEKILLIADDNGPSVEVSRRAVGVRVDVDLTKAMQDSRYTNARSLRLAITKPGYNTYFVTLERTADPASGSMIDIPVTLERETGSLRVVGERLPFYSAIRTTLLNGTPLDQIRSERPLEMNSPMNLITGRYKVELIADRSKTAGIEVADRPVGEVVINASKSEELRLPPFEVPRMLAGYVRIDWRDYFSKTFRPLGDSTPPGEVKNIKWSTWSPVVVVLDESFTSGEVYEAHNLVTSFIVEAFNMSVKIDAQNASTIKDNAERLLRSLNLPMDPKPEWVVEAAKNLEQSADALWKYSSANPDQRVNSARESYPYFRELMAATQKAAWQRLVQACVGTGSVLPADLQELAKPPTGKKLGYLVRSKFAVNRCEADGSLELTVRRHTILGKAWDSNDPEDWNPGLRSIGAAAGRYPWKLSGKWQDDPCEFKLREITEK